MSLERELEDALKAAARHTGVDRPVAVLPAEPRAGARVYLAAFAGEDDLSYLAVDAAGRPVADRRLVRDTVSMLALAERADEVSGAMAAEELERLFSAAAEAMEAAGMAEERAAATAAAAAVRAMAAEAAGPRVATPAYLDRIAGRAAELAVAVDAFAAHAERLSAGAAGADAEAATIAADAAWQAMAAVARGGEPANFATALAASGGVVEALVADVLESYRGELR